MMTVPSYAVTAQIPVGVTPVGVAISPRRDYVYVTSFVDHAAVTVLRTDDATTTTIPLTFRPEGIVVGADGRHLYVADPTGNRVAVIDTTDRSTVFVPVGNKAAGSPPTRCRSSTRPAEWSSRPFPLEATRSRSVKAE